MARLTAELRDQTKEAARLDEVIWANLKDIGNYLRGNLSPANLASAGDLVQKASTEAKEVDGRIATIVEAIDKISSATGAGAAAAPGR